MEKRIILGLMGATILAALLQNPLAAAGALAALAAIAEPPKEA